ncbi:MAG: hypothetical protein A2X86_21730 [Bdellovibrionales bacterium GWA2_49_15]|nr:MAG: hypothetical protein A2X86_21730 [Bdellovibrionales bacterium GWA2_49_15]
MERSPESPAMTFPIVGIGASAGGLEAIKELLQALPTDTGMGFVLIQHLDPKHDSLSEEILSRTTKMIVTEVKDGMTVKPNKVYIIPPGFSMQILHGVLHLTPRSESPGQNLVIDVFFGSLAEDQRNLAIGIVLSGTGTDGTLGLMAIKAEGGITFAQIPTSAKFDNMPQSAIASGSVDLSLTPQKIAQELVRISHHPYVAPIAPPTLPTVTEDGPPLKPQDSLGHIFLLLRNQCHVDFSYYKSNTIKRRIERRMVLHRLEDLKAYTKFLAQTPGEVKALYDDILIHVTGFFRDPEAFEALKTIIFPKLLENRVPGTPIRIWVPGCSTGEEAYSMAICLLEFLGEKVSLTPIQIFATDVSERAILKARLGEYPENISGNVSGERLSRFFLKLEGKGYKIAKSIRDICVFSRHDVTSDPPFAKIDLISCRNLLIYFTPTLQKHVISIFNDSLASHGLLYLGKSETIGGASELFSVIDQVNKVYVKKNGSIAHKLRFPARTYVHEKKQFASAANTSVEGSIDLDKITEQTIQDEYPGVLVNEDMEILQVRGRLTPFVELVPGIPRFNLLKMAHPKLLRELRKGLQEAEKTKAPFRREELSIPQGRRVRSFNLNVIPVKHPPNSKKLLYLVLFEKKSAAKLKKKRKLPLKTKGQKEPSTYELEQELAELQEYQHSLVKKFENTQEDLSAANEELQSANEELQSTNEELETAKEELQSGNEELTTVNDELQTRSVEQLQTTNDLINILGSVEIPILMLSNDRRIRRFNPVAGKALNLIDADVGRPLSDLRLNLTSPSGPIDLEKMVSATIETVVSQEIEVQDVTGHWFRLQMRPYKTVENKIDGVVLALIDIDSLKMSLKEVRLARSEAEKANRAKDLFLATLSHELRTPLTAILSWAQMLRSGKLNADMSKHAMEVIEESGKIQATLINELLDVSRIVAGKVALETGELDPATVVSAAIETVRPTAQAKAILIETFFAPNVGTIMADPTRLRQVFCNLLTNAIKFSAPQSKVSVSVKRINEKDGETAMAVISVADSGKGIDAEFLPQIFNRFSQEDSSSTRLQGGLGMGLAIAKDLVELQGGTIRAESLGSGHGATFTVIFPIKSNQTLPAPQGIDDQLKNSANRDTRPLRLDGVRVLIVEDEANTREAFGEMLRLVGAEVKLAESAHEGLRIFQQFRPHVLISDIAMPEEDGYGFIKKVRALPADNGGNTPALAITAYAGPEDIKRVLSAGFQAHLAKPVDGQNLAKNVLQLVPGPFR